jgi:hypothetical protein
VTLKRIGFFVFQLVAQLNTQHTLGSVTIGFFCFPIKHSGSTHTLLPPPREQLCNSSCSNKTHLQLEYGEATHPGPPQSTDHSPDSESSARRHDGRLN